MIAHNATLRDDPFYVRSAALACALNGPHAGGKSGPVCASLDFLGWIGLERLSCLYYSEPGETGNGVPAANFRHRRYPRLLSIDVYTEARRATKAQSMPQTSPPPRPSSATKSPPAETLCP